MHRPSTRSSTPVAESHDDADRPRPARRRRSSPSSAPAASAPCRRFASSIAPRPASIARRSDAGNFERQTAMTAAIAAGTPRRSRGTPAAPTIAASTTTPATAPSHDPRVRRLRRHPRRRRTGRHDAARAQHACTPVAAPAPAHELHPGSRRLRSGSATTWGCGRRAGRICRPDASQVLAVECPGDARRARSHDHLDHAPGVCPGRGHHRHRRSPCPRPSYERGVELIGADGQRRTHRSTRSGRAPGWPSRIPPPRRRCPYALR